MTFDDQEPAAVDILERISDGFIRYDAQGIIRYWNRQAECLLGIERGGVLGQEFWSCFPEEVDRFFYQCHRRVLRTGEPDTFEGYFARAGRWFEVNAFPADGGLALFFRDVTARREREQEFRALFDNAPQPQWLFDPQTLTVVEVNEAALWEYGYTRDEFLRLTITELRPPEDREAFLDLVKDATRKRLYEDVRHQRADGSRLLVRVRTTPVTFGGRRAVLATIHDVTAKKAALEALRRSEEDNRRLFDNAPLPQCLCSLDAHRLLRVNEAAVALYGWTAAEWVHLSAYDLCLPEDRPAFAEGLRLLQATGTVRSTIRHRVKSGALIVVELAATLVEQEGERCILVTLNDITYERQLEENLSALKVSAQKSLTRAQLTAQEEERATIGRELHDNINQQLAAIKLFVEMARARDDLRPDLLEKSGRLLQDAIDGIRALSKHLVAPAFGAGLGTALQELCATFATGASFAVHCQAVEVDDPELALTLYRVVQEALTNASRYAAPQNLWVRLARDAEGLLLEVRDDGRGFDPSVQGKGIGLANIARRVELFNGRLDVVSAPGAGCTLSVRLPLAGAEERPLLVAIAEDDADDRELLEEALHAQAPQCRLHFSGNGMDLLEYLHAAPAVPDLIILDRNMPLLNGVDTLQALSLEPRFRRVPKVLYSTTIRPEDRRGAYAAAYIQKPSDPQGVRNCVGQMLLLVRGR